MFNPLADWAGHTLTRGSRGAHLTPGEAVELSRLFEVYAKILEAKDFEVRLAALESRMGRAK
jgi:hypothetical protein